MSVSVDDPVGASKQSPVVLVTGATGYVGGRLVPALLQRGYAVRCVVREPRKLAERPWRDDPNVEVRTLDLQQQDALTDAMKGCAAAYYLVHSMIAANDEYRSRDRALAASFAAAAEQGAVGRIIYLGGLGELGDDLSEHLASRREVEDELSSTSVPVTTLRAAMIIGSGSASFEILRYLVEHLPAMLTPRWVRTESQPIAIRNVVHYLVTPVPHTIARPLAEGLRNRTVCRDTRAAEWMPQQLLTMREAIDAAIGRQESDEVATAWTDAGVLPGDPD